MALTGTASKHVTMISASSERLFEFIIVAFLERDGAENASLSPYTRRMLTGYAMPKTRCSLTENQTYLSKGGQENDGILTGFAESGQMGSSPINAGHSS